MSSKPRILLVGGFRNWAYDFKSDGLIKYLGDDYEFDKFYTEESHVFDHTQYDAVYIYWWFSKTYISEVPKQKLGGGLTSHRRLDEMSEDEKKEMVNWFHVFSANSRSLYELFKPYRPDIHYTPNGVDIDFFKPVKVDQSNDIFTIGWVGNAEDQFKLFHEIIQPLSKSLPQFRFLFATKKNLRAREEMPGFYAQCDCLLVASVNEGTPNPALEAAACGVPIVANAVGNMPDLINEGENGFLVRPELDEYREKILFLSKNRRIAREMGLAMREEVARHWSWEMKAEAYRPIFDALV